MGVVTGTATITNTTFPTTNSYRRSGRKSATLRWTISMVYCAPSTDDVILVNNALPTNANAGTDINQCNISSFTLAGNVAVTGSGLWTVVTGTATITTASVRPVV